MSEGSDCSAQRMTLIPSRVEVCGRTDAVLSKLKHSACLCRYHRDHCCLVQQKNSRNPDCDSSRREVEGIWEIRPHTGFGPQPQLEEQKRMQDAKEARTHQEAGEAARCCWSRGIRSRVIMNWIVIIGSTNQGLDLSSGCQMRLAGF